MRSWKSRNFLLALSAIALTVFTVSLVPAARKSTPQCMKGCGDVRMVCNDRCVVLGDVCKDNCKEGSKDQQTTCVEACNVVKNTCIDTCDGMNDECRLGCPRGNKVSASDPAP